MRANTPSTTQTIDFPIPISISIIPQFTFFLLVNYRFYLVSLQFHSSYRVASSRRSNGAVRRSKSSSQHTQHMANGHLKKPRWKSRKKRVSFMSIGELLGPLRDLYFDFLINSTHTHSFFLQSNSTAGKNLIYFICFRSYFWESLELASWVGFGEGQ